MPLDGLVPAQVLAVLAAATVFVVMLDLGLGIVPREFAWLGRHPAVLFKALASVLIIAPAIALTVTWAFQIPRAADIGIVLMAISPGAPIALRRSLDAGGHRSFAPALQILVTMLAVVSMPLWVAALNVLYAGHAAVSPSVLAKQVFIAQLLPLMLGMLARRAFAQRAAWLEPKLARLGKAMLLLLTAAVLATVWRVVIDAGFAVALAIAIVTALALAAGHAMGGPEAATRTAVAICSGLRNPGLALLVATANSASAQTVATIVAYLVVSGVTVITYAGWRRATSAGAMRRA